MNRIFTTTRRSGRGGRRKKSTIRSCAKRAIDSTLSGSGDGRNALLMSKTAADVESYVAYQP